MGRRGPGGGPDPPRHRGARAARNVPARGHASRHRLLRLRGRVGPLRLLGFEPADVGRRGFDDRAALRRRGVGPCLHGIGPLRRPRGDPGRDGRPHRDAGEHPASGLVGRIPVGADPDGLPVRRGGHHHRPSATRSLGPAFDRRFEPAPLRLRAHPSRPGQRVVARDRARGPRAHGGRRAHRPPRSRGAGRHGRLHRAGGRARPPGPRRRRPGHHQVGRTTLRGHRAVVVRAGEPGAAGRRGGPGRRDADSGHHPGLRGGGRLRRRCGPRLPGRRRRQRGVRAGGILPGRRQSAPHGRGRGGRRPHAGWRLWVRRRAWSFSSRSRAS